MKLTYVHKMALSWGPGSKSFIASSVDCTTKLCTHVSGHLNVFDRQVGDQLSHILYVRICATCICEVSYNNDTLGASKGHHVGYPK